MTISSLSMNKRLIYLALLPALLASCQMQEAEVGVPAPEITARVEAEPATRTVLDVDGEGAGTISWMPADRINVFFGKTGTLYTSQNSSNATSAVFRTADNVGMSELSSTNIWGLYPYNGSATCTGSEVTTTLPAAQAGVPGTFDDDLFITLAHSSTNDLQFYNVCSGIKFSLSRDDIKSVSFKGNNNEDLVGDISLTFENSRPKATVTKGIKEITLTPKTGQTLAKGANYYIVTLPVTLSKGFTITFTTTGGSVGTLNYADKSVTLERAVFSRKSQLDTYASFADTHEPVDLGLSVMWASCNVGASSPEEYGDYFAWGETEPKSEYTWSNYKFRVTGDSDSSVTFSKYNTKSDRGTLDNKTQLKLSDDAARSNWGGSWRMPTEAEWTELCDNCTWTWTTQNGVKGYKVTSKKNGNSIFLPAAGAREGTSLFGKGFYGYYFSSTLFPDLSHCACIGYFEPSVVSEGGVGIYRFTGGSVRPVYGEFVEVSSISLNKTSANLNVGESLTLTATIQPGNATAKDIYWSSSDPNIASVSASGVVTAKAVGTATITAYASNGLSASCTITVSNPIVSVTGVSLNETSMSMTIGDTQTLVATVTPSDATDKSVTWSSNNTSVATVSSSGLVTAKSAGTATITATTNDGGKKASCVVTVSAPTVSVTGVELNESSMTMTVGDTQTLVATVTPSNATNKSVTWSSNNTSVATVSSSGLVTAKSAGTATITVTTNDGGKKATCSVTVSAATVSVTGVSLDKTSMSMTVGDTQTLTATITPSNATNKSVSWSSNNTSIATVSSYGVVTAKAAGTATITVTTNDGSKTAICSVTVSQSVPEAVDLGLSVKWASFNVGASSPEGYGDYFAWGETSPKSNYSWSAYKWCNGSETNLTKYNTKTNYGTVDNKTQLDLSDDAARANWGGKWRMPTMAEREELCNYCTWTWTTQNGVNGYRVTSKTNGNSIFLPAAGCWVGSSLVQAGSLGSYWSSTLNTDYPYCAFYVNFVSDNVYRSGNSRYEGRSVRPVYGEPAEVSVTGVSLDKTSMSMTVGDTQTLTATVMPSDATNKSISWSSNNTSVATVSSSGVVTAKAAGSATITVTTNNGGKKATCSVTVSAATVSVTGVSLDKSSMSMTVGDTHTLTATVTPSNATNKSVSWSSNNTSVATVSSSGVVTAKAAGSTTITVTTNDGSKKATCSVTVSAATVSVTGVSLDKTSMSMTVGDTQTLMATITPSNATNKSVTWSSNNTSVATVSSSGAVMAKAAGSATITVTTNDGGKKATCSVTVSQSDGHEAVDLGLSVKWATCNVGASSPEDYGDYFAWGETSPKSDYIWKNYVFWVSGDSWRYIKFSKYNTASDHGRVDNKTQLELSDDSARANWGGNWRMPTITEWKELQTNCSWTLTTQNGVEGYLVTSNINGTSIFLPAAGYRGGTSLYSVGSYGLYWSSTINTGNPTLARCLYMTSNVSTDYEYRYEGLSVRPVTE